MNADTERGRGLGRLAGECRSNCLGRMRPVNICRLPAPVLGMGRRRLERHERGFSLIELVVVIIIIGLLAALVGPRIFGRVGQSKQAAAQAQIELLGAALDHYRLDVGRYPTTEEGLKALAARPFGVENWAGPYLKKDLPDDPWGRPYVYKAPGDEGREYEIVSYGADGKPAGTGEDEDIVSWRFIKAKERQAR